MPSKRPTSRTYQTQPITGTKATHIHDPRFVAVMKAFDTDGDNRPRDQKKVEDNASIHGSRAPSAKIYAFTNELNVQGDEGAHAKRQKTPAPQRPARNSPLEEKKEI